MASMTELAFCSAIELAKMIRDGKVSSSELLDLYLSRIEKYNPQLNAVITLDIERARQQARLADQARFKGEKLGPLHGLPVTIKDALETAGVRTTCGAPRLRDHIPQTDAVAVQRYKKAGAIVFGKTNVPLFCSDFQSYNDIFGTTRNPWDPGRTPGGSSGGAAAALAAGLTGLELGSDIAGSIRTPACWSGVYGHKPSYGIVPQKGHIPPPPGIVAEGDLGVIGPLARSASDLMLALEIVAGPDAMESIGWSLNLPAPRAGALRQYRVAAWIDDTAMDVDHQVQERLHAAVEVLRADGVSVDERARPAVDMSQAFSTFQALMIPLMASGFPLSVYESLEKQARSEDPRSERGAYARYVTATHRRWLSANAKRAAYRVQWAEFFKRYDVLLCPVISVPAIAHDSERPQLDRTITINGKSIPYRASQYWTGLITLAHLPATSAPIGRTREGLPVGIQIVGPYLEDRTPIDFADKLSKLIGGFEPPPGY
jgi:amidase